MNRERPLLERVCCRLLIVSMIAMQLPLASLAHADDVDDALSGDSFGFTYPDPPAKAGAKPKVNASGGIDGAKGADGKSDDQGVANSAAQKKADPAKPDAKKDDKSVKSPIALCDTDDGTESAKPGYGAPVAKWPAPNTPEYQRQVEKFIKDKAANSVDNPSMNGTHKSYPGNQEARPDLSPSIAARQRFFDVAFGVSKDGTLGSATIAICEVKRQLAQHLKAYTDQKQKETDTTACSGAFKQTFTLYKTAHKSYLHYSDVIDHFLKGYSGKMNGKDTKIASLENEFFENRRKNLDNLNLYKPPVTAQRPIKVSDTAWKSLKAEYEMLWGKGSADHASGDKQIDLTGLYSNMLLQTRKEKAKAEEQAAFFKKEGDAVEDRAKKCGLETSQAAVKPQTAVKPSASTITGDIKPGKAPDLSGASAPNPPRQVPSDADDTASTKRKEDLDAREKQLDERQKQLDQQGQNNQDTSGGNQNNSNDTNAGPPPPAQPQPSAAGQFLKDNWMWLAAGGVLIGGGVWYYQKYKKDQKQKAYWQDDMNFLPPRPTPTTVTVGGTGAAPGSHFMFVSSITGPGGIGQSMGPIGVIVTDGNNIVQNVSGVITLSCAAPSPCSIGGGTSASLVNGQATFTGVTFSQPDQNVLLQVSGAGVPAATAPSSFNVGGSTATNPRY